MVISVARYDWGEQNPICFNDAYNRRQISLGRANLAESSDSHNRR